MKFLMIFGFFLVFLVQASFQYPHHHHQHHKKHLIVPETIEEEVYDNQQMNDETNGNEERIIENDGQNMLAENNKAIILLDLEDLMNLFAIKTVDNTLENPGFNHGEPRKRGRRQTQDSPKNLNIPPFEKDVFPQTTFDLSDLTKNSVEPKLTVRVNPLSGNVGVGARITDTGSEFQPQLSTGIDSNGNFNIGAGFSPNDRSKFGVQFEPATGKVGAGISIKFD